MAMYDRQWFLDVRSVLDKASVLKVEPKQSIEPAPVGPNPNPVETHVAYDYSDGAFPSCWALAGGEFYFWTAADGCFVVTDPGKKPSAEYLAGKMADALRAEEARREVNKVEPKQNVDVVRVSKFETVECGEPSHVYYDAGYFVFSYGHRDTAPSEYAPPDFDCA